MGLTNIFSHFQTFHSEAEDAFAPIPPQMVQFSYVCVQGSLVGVKYSIINEILHITNLYEDAFLFSKYICKFLLLLISASKSNISGSND